VVLPVHNEEELLPGALNGLEVALSAVARRHLQLGVVIVLDRCGDRSAPIAQSWVARVRRSDGSVYAQTLTCDENNVGVARYFGCRALLERWCNIDTARIWLATSDADSRVPPNWLVAQVQEHARGAELWTGRVTVDDWSLYRSDTQERWSQQYEDEEDPIHGASLGFSGSAYLAAGGFPPLRSGEDRSLCRLLLENGAQWHRDSSARVVTSARRDARAPEGFADALATLDAHYDAGDSA
jgi:glycosyltransferase involved in cell wall biosynthesis